MRPLMCFEVTALRVHLLAAVEQAFVYSALVVVGVQFEFGASFRLDGRQIATVRVCTVRRTVRGRRRCEHGLAVQRARRGDRGDRR